MKSWVFILIMMSGVVSGAHSQTANDIPRLTQAMDAVVQLDSRSWMFNRYDVGSMTGVYVSNFGDISVAHGDYTYNRGVRGWVRIQFSGEQIRCVEYHDFAGTCRPVGQNPARQAFMAVAVEAFAPGGASSSGSSSELQRCLDRAGGGAEGQRAAQSCRQLYGGN